LAVDGCANKKTALKKGGSIILIGWRCGAYGGVQFQGWRTDRLVVFLRIRFGFFEDFVRWFSQDLADFSGIWIGGFLRIGLTFQGFRSMVFSGSG